MTPEEWKRVKAIAMEAWTRRGDEQAAYIDHACARDDQLHRDVSTLVASMKAAEGRFEVPPPLPSSDVRFRHSLEGSWAGAYEILAPIGAGGMGTVYKARDSRLDRIVAIKMLPGTTCADFSSRERLKREARTIAALNHPNICTVHDIGRQDGRDFLVMEYLEGETLAARLARGPLALDEALHYAQQIGSALAAAHRAGIVHRDVKPANIMLTGSLQAGLAGAKLLDFGIAKSASPEAPGDRVTGRVAAADLNASASVLGTAYYTAPEQCDGRATDARTDVFAFGAVLFEMLTARKAFQGNDRTAVLAAVRQKEVPRPSRLEPALPAPCDRVVLRCLAKDPEARYQTIDDLLGDLRALERRLKSLTRWRLLSAAAILTVAVGGGVWAFLPARGSGIRVTPSVTRLPASAGVLGGAALSPDGSSLVFSWAGDTFTNPELVLLRVGSTTRVRLTDDPGVEEWPAWSPDGSQIAFVRCGAGRCGIFALAVRGGPERKLLDLRDDRYYGLAWAPDGDSIVYAQRSSASTPYALFVLTLSTGTSRPLSIPATGRGELRFAVSPDGRTIAAIRLQDDGIAVHLIPVATGRGRVLVAGQQEWFGSVTWSADGDDLILSANQNGIRRLWRLPVAGGGLEQLAIAGEDAYFPSVSAQAGRLTFVREFRDWDLSRLTLSAEAVPAPAPFPSSNRLDLDPAFSPDGGRLAFVSERSGSREVWVSNADGSEPVQLTSFNGPTAGRPSWSPDGRHLALHANGIHVISVHGGVPRQISEDGEMPTWSANGQSIYFVRNRTGRYHVWKIPSTGGPPVQAITSEASAAREAPNGDLYFVRFDGGIWRQSVAGGEERRVVGDFAWSLPGFWSVFDEGIYYVVRQSLSETAFVHHLRFFDFSTSRSTDLGTLAGNLDHWVGTMTVSRDRRSVIYSQRTYQSSEIVLVEPFR